MRRDSKILNRTLAVAIAAAMAITSAPSMAFAGDVFDDGTEIEAVQAAPEATETETQAAEAEAYVAEAEVLDAESVETTEAALDAVVTDEIFDDSIVEAETEAVTETAAAEEAVVSDEESAEAGIFDADASVTAPEKPAQVTGAVLDSDNSNLLTWYYVDAADYYEISVEANGYVYAPNYSSPDYYETESRNYDLTDITSWIAYKVNTDGSLERVSENDQYVYTKPGETYSVKVRAVNEGSYDSTTGKYAETAGDWSEAVSYTLPANLVGPDKPSEVKISSEGKLTFTAPDNADSVEMRVVDQAGTEYYNYVYANGDSTEYTYLYAYSGMTLSKSLSLYQWEKKEGYSYWTQVNTGTDENASYVKAFQVGSTYNVSLRAYSYVNGQKAYSAWTDAVAYTPAETAKPDTTSVSISGNTVTWNAVDGASGYEILVKDAAGTEYHTGNEKYPYARVGNSSYSSTSTAVKVSSVKISRLQSLLTTKDSAGNTVKPFLTGQSYTISVRAYNTLSDDTEQAADWSEAVTYTKQTVSAPAQVTGVAITPEGVLSWDKAEVTGSASVYYEISIKDSSNREYYENAYNKYDETTKTYAVTYEYYSTASTSASPYSARTYVLVDGEPQSAKYASGSTIYALDENGMTYTLAVRAVASYTDDSGKAQKVYGSWSSAVTYTKSMPAKGVNATPAKVTGLTLETVDEEGASLSGATLYWNSIENAEYYEALIKDASGNEYFYYTYESNEYVKNYPQISVGSAFPSIAVSDLAGWKSYVKNDGTAKETVKDASGEDLETFAAGSTYTIQIRAVNVYSEWDTNLNYYTEKATYYGEWSDAVTYTEPGVAAITDLSFVREADDVYYFTYSAVVDNSKVYYQVATDTAFTTASLVKDWTEVSGNDKLSITNSGIYEAGKTYYVRAVSSTTGGPEEEDLAKLASIPTASFTVAAKSPKNITGLALDQESSSNYVFTFDAILESDDYYEIQYSYDGTNWITGAENNTSLTKSQLNEGSVQVRAIAYIYQKNQTTGSNEKVYGTASNVVTVTVSRATTAISDLKLAETTASYYQFSFSGSPRQDEYVQIWISENSDFTTYDSTLTSYSTVSGTNYFRIYYTKLTPGKTYYIRARVYNKNENLKTDEQYSAFTNTLTLKATMPKVTVSQAVVTSTSVQLKLSAVSSDKYMTGFEVQKKVDKKWKAVAKTTDNTVKDSKLKKDTTYTYRVRAYYYNSETKKTTNGAWTYYETTTWGASLNLKATAKSKTSIKLSWNKVSGASGYEVYRMVTSSAKDETTGLYSNAYSKYVLVKTFKKASKKTYTDKKLNADLEYTYYVRAYKTVDGKKYYIGSNTASVDLAFGDAIDVTDQTVNSDGTVTVTWSRVYSAAGYLVEKYDDDTDSWTTYKTVKSSKTTITLPQNTETDVAYYRIRAYKGTEYSTAYQVSVDRYLAAPTNVTAKASSDGSITVSWSAVSGADYYEVYRTTSSSSASVYDTTKKVYTIAYAYSIYEGTDFGSPMTQYVEDSSKVSGYRVATEPEEKAGTTYVDKEITYTINGVTNTLEAGPQKDVTYYYYVKAVKLSEGSIYADSKENDVLYSSGYSKAAKATVSSSITVKAPAIKSVKAASKKVTITWKKVTGAEGYVVYRSTSKNKGYEAIATITKGSTVKYVDKTAKKGTKYYYKVKAYKLNEAGLEKLSSFSKVKSVKAK